LTSLVKKIDEALDKAGGKREGGRGLGAFIIFDGKADGLDKQLLAMAEKESLKRVSLCIGAPPADYEVAKEADVTVVIYTAGRRPQQKVTANFALYECDLDEEKADAIVKALVEVLPK
jgi:hypothetical protein